MKKIIRTLALICAATVPALFASCTADMEFKDVNVSEITQLYEPADGRSVTLEASATASLYFEWERSHAEDAGAPQYEVAFYTSADATTPIYKIASDDKGGSNYASILHKTLNKVCKAADIEPGDAGTLYWSVIASKGLTQVPATVKYALNLTSLEGFDPVPTKLTLTGSDLEQECASPSAGEFEIFCKLNAGTAYTFTDGETTYYLDGSKIREYKDGVTVPAIAANTGVYRINLDFAVAAVNVREIKSVGFWFCPENDTIFDLDYVGNGVFSAKAHLKMKDQGGWFDERYKFVMEYADGTRQMWGTLNNTDGRPGGLPEGDSYYAVTETDWNQWDQKWKFDAEFDDQDVIVTLTLSGAQYTHFIKHAN